MAAACVSGAAKIVKLAPRVHKSRSLGYSCSTTLAVWAAPRSAPQVLHSCFLNSVEATVKDSVMLWEGEVQTRNRHNH